MTMRALVIAFAVAGAAGCGSEESFTPQIASTEHLIGSDAVATLAKGDEAANQVVVAGDLDGDGIDDAVVQTITTDASAPIDDYFQLTAYIAYGGDALRGQLDYSSLPSLTGIREGFLVVAPVGDVDGDGLADLLVGRQRRVGCSNDPNAPQTDEPWFSGAYLVYGSRTRLTGANPIADAGVFLRDLKPCTEVLWMTGLGDLDGDGRADFAIGSAPSLSGGATEIYVFYGRGARFAAAALDTADAVIRPSAGLVRSSIIIQRAGDVDGDGFSDFMVSTEDGVETNQVSMVRGSAQRLAGALVAEDIAQVQDAVHIGCTAALGLNCAFLAMAPLGDLDGDGFDDFAMPHFKFPDADPYSGWEHRVFYGSAAGFPAHLDLGSEAALIRGVGPTDWTEIGAGDVDGDGARDLVISDKPADDFNGAVHLLGGDGSRLSGTIDLAAQGTSYIGQTFRAPNCEFADKLDCTANEVVGYSLAVGDLTGDHRADFVVSAPAGRPRALRGVPGSALGHSYVVAPGSELRK